MMNENTGLKDWFYYDDLIYKIKSLADINQIENKETESRIWKREEMTGTIENNGLVSYTLSSFQSEVFKIVRGISKKVGVSFRSLHEISKYPELVNECLIELEKMKSLNNMLLEKKRTSYVTAIPNMNKAFIITPEISKYLLSLSEEKIEDIQSEKSKSNTLEESEHKVRKKLLSL